MINVDLSGLFKAIGSALSGGVKQRPTGGANVPIGPYGSVPVPSGSEYYVRRPFWAKMFNTGETERADNLNYFNMAEDKDLAKRLAIEKYLQEGSLDKYREQARLNSEAAIDAANRGFKTSLGLAPTASDESLASIYPLLQKRAMSTAQAGANTAQNEELMSGLNTQATRQNLGSYYDTLTNKMMLDNLQTKNALELSPYQQRANIAGAQGAEAAGTFQSKYPYTAITTYGGQALGINQEGQPTTFNEVYDKPTAPKDPDQMAIFARAKVLKKLHPDMEIYEAMEQARQELMSNSQTMGAPSPAYKIITNPATGQSWKVPVQ